MVTADGIENRQRLESETPWLRWYDPGVPESITIPDLSLPDALAITAGRYPDRIAIRFEGRNIEYGELNEAVNRFANALLALGIRKRNRVGLLLPNCPQIVIGIFGTLRAGAVAVLTSPLSSGVEMRHVWRESGVRVALCLSTFYQDVQGLRGELPDLDYVVYTNIKEYLPLPTRLLFTLVRERREGHAPSLPRDGHTHWLPPLLARAALSAPNVKVVGSDLALLQPTGGTTGLPKLAMLAHRNLLANALQESAWFTPLARPDRADKVLGVVPIFHIYGVTTVLNYSLVNGATMILQPRFLPRDVVRTIKRENVAFFPGVPAMYRAITRIPDINKHGLRSLKLGISGAAPLPESVQTEFESVTGATLVEGYGLTEAGPVTHCSPLMGRRKAGSIGIPLVGTEAAIFDIESGTKRLPAGQVGELAVRGPQVMLGYWQQDEETALALRDGWLFTGDLGRMDDDGFFYIVDRKKDMIDTGGMKVFPRDVEEPLHGHPKVSDVVAVGIPDETWGEAVKVYVVLKPGERATAQEIRDYCRDRMAHYKVPKYVEFRTDLPRNVIGKVLRRRLIAEERVRTSTPSKN